MISQRTAPANAHSGNRASGNGPKRGGDSPNVQLAERFAPFAQKMRAEGLPEALIHTFQHYYRQLLEGETGYIASAHAQPVEALPLVEELDDYKAIGQEALGRTVMIKLNGGLGTTMGLESPKSLITVKQELSFLDIIVRQVLHLRRQHQVELPLVLMNSFNTQAATRAALDGYPELTQRVAHDFLQHKIPKVWQHDLSPAEWPADPEKEWCPPGHGNLYLALYTSGLLTELLDAGYEYAFISNADNLGAVMDLSLLGYFAENGLPFLMEVAVRSEADRKGGHLAKRQGKGLILREVAQCPPDELEQFQDTARYCYFNTNNIWIDLRSLEFVLQQRKGFIDLPLIRNSKPVDPTDPESPAVYQMETAMGQAIAVFPGARAVQVGRERFLPVKSTSDLLALRSDLYLLNEDYTIERNPAREIEEDIVIELDEHYRSLEQLEAHFPGGVPSLVNCRRLHIEGDIYFPEE